MNSNISCVKKEWGRFCRAIDRPVVRKHIDAGLGIFSHEGASKPIVELKVDGEWCYKLSCAIKVVTAILIVIWLIHRFSYMLRKWL